MGAPLIFSYPSLAFENVLVQVPAPVLYRSYTHTLITYRYPHSIDHAARAAIKKMNRSILSMWLQRDHMIGQWLQQEHAM